MAYIVYIWVVCKCKQSTYVCLVEHRFLYILYNQLSLKTLKTDGKKKKRSVMVILFIS